MIRFSRVTILSALMALGFVSQASAATVRGGVTWLGTYSMPQGTPAASSAFNPAGGGAMLDIVFGRVGLGIGAGYRSRQYTQGGNQTTGLIDGTLAFEIYLGRFIELGLGGYYSYIMSKTQASLAGNDYGALGKLQFNIPLGQKAALVLGGEYHYALSRLTITGGNVTPHDVVGFAGIRFGASGK